MTCRSKNCEVYEDFKEWYNQKVGKTDEMYSMPDDCSRCKRAYKDFYRSKNQQPRATEKHDCTCTDEVIL